MEVAEFSVFLLKVILGLVLGRPHRVLLLGLVELHLVERLLV